VIPIHFASGISVYIEDLVSKFSEGASLQWFGEEVGKHVTHCWTVFNLHFPVGDIDVARSFTTRSPPIFSSSITL
jgi:hypothetical protein